jgi:type VI secretion system secreted protein VgrG
MASTLITSANSRVTLTGGALSANVFWQVGSSATLGTGTSFQGNILADQSITLTTGATVTGRALALNGAVTMDNNTINIPMNAVAAVPEPATILAGLSALGMLGLFGWRNRK